MSICRTVRAFTNLAVDAVEALAFLFDFSDVADQIWADARANRLVDKEAKDERSDCGLCGRRDSTAYTDGLCGNCNYSLGFDESSSPANAAAGDDQPAGSVLPRDVEPAGLQTTLADLLRAHGDSGHPHFANERVCVCGSVYRTMAPAPDFADHLAEVLRRQRK